VHQARYDKVRMENRNLQAENTSLQQYLSDAQQKCVLLQNELKVRTTSVVATPMMMFQSVQTEPSDTCNNATITELMSQLNDLKLTLTSKENYLITKDHNISCLQKKYLEATKSIASLNNQNAEFTHDLEVIQEKLLEQEDGHAKILQENKRLDALLQATRMEKVILESTLEAQYNSSKQTSEATSPSEEVTTLQRIQSAQITKRNRDMEDEMKRLRESNAQFRSALEEGRAKVKDLEKVLKDRDARIQCLTNEKHGLHMQMLVYSDAAHKLKGETETREKEFKENNHSRQNSCGGRRSSCVTPRVAHDMMAGPTLIRRPSLTTTPVSKHRNNTPHGK
jgi:chromosome segregation ATPase